MRHTRSNLLLGSDPPSTFLRASICFLRTSTLYIRYWQGSREGAEVVREEAVARLWIPWQADEENAEIRRTVIGTIDWERQYRFDYSVTLGLSGIIRIVRHGLEDDVYARSPG